MEEYKNISEAEKELIENFVNPRLKPGALAISQSYFDLAERLLKDCPPSHHRLMTLENICRSKDSHIKAWFKGEGFD